MPVDFIAGKMVYYLQFEKVIADCTCVVVVYSASLSFLGAGPSVFLSFQNRPGLLPPVLMSYLPDRYVKTYDRVNCLGQRVSSREYQCHCPQL